MRLRPERECECGAELPEIGLYGVMKHVCRRCGRDREVCGAGVMVTVPPGAERIEELEKMAGKLERAIRAILNHPNVDVGMALRALKEWDE